MIDELARLYLLRRHGLYPTCGDDAQVPHFRPRLRAIPVEGHMHNEPVAYGKPPVEAKVKWTAFGAYLASVAAMGVLQAIDADHSLIEVLPDWLEALAIPLLPTAIAAVAGFKAKHTARPDLPADKR